MAAPVRSFVLGYGDATNRDTLEYMRTFAREGAADPLTRRTVAAILTTVPRSDRTGAAVMIRGWLADRWRFVADPKGLERVTTPHQLLLDFQRTATLAGDCDDVAVLAASMGLIAGLRSRYVAVGFEGPTRPVRHVFAELATPLGWVDMDITRPADIPPVNRVITVDI